MPIPDYETLMHPILKYLDDGTTRRTRDIINGIIHQFEITSEEAKELIPSGRAKLIDNRVGWACTYLRRAGLITSPQRGRNTITDEGRTVLKKEIDRITTKYLKEQYAVFQENPSEKSSSAINTSENDLGDKTPEEIIGLQFSIITANLAEEVLSYVSQMEPDQFEQLVVDLLLAMGYGGTVEDAGSAIGRSNDGGIDGLIKEDVLGFETIYIQAKRWQNVVPVKEVRDFAGALLSMRSNKGVFITTSTFPQSAREFVASIDRKIILIDGQNLAQLIIKNNLGVTVREEIQIKEVDIDFFV